MKGAPASDILAELPIPPEEYAVELFVGVSRRAAEVDETILSHANAWALDRMPAVDRQLLRLGVYELIDHPEVPVAVIIDEAVELAKQYSTDDSSRFVNGVLAAVAAARRPGEVVAP